jgi:hypothetical protein
MLKKDPNPPSNVAEASGGVVDDGAERRQAVAPACWKTTAVELSLFL